MTHLSIIIPARNEEFLQTTIENCLDNIRGDTEIIAILDGYWPNPGIKQHARVNIVHLEEPIGQRAAVNRGALMSTAKFIMKLDAHCAVDEGFDVKLMADCDYMDTIIPAMYNLHAFDWVCHVCGYRAYQGSLPDTCECGKKDFKKEIIWKPKHNPRSEFYRFDTDMKFKYWRAFKRRPEAKSDLAPSLGNLGACFFIHRKRFYDIDMLDEAHGGWGQFGTEISCKSWLSGGRQMVNKNTWFSHMFRTGGGFGFPYQLSKRQTNFARAYSQKLWLGDNWPKAKHSLKWLIEKFHPVPEWEQYDWDKRGASDSGVEPKKVAPETKMVAVKNTALSNPTKGLVYYSNNLCEDRIFTLVQRQLKSYFTGQIVSVTQFPVDFGENIVVDFKSSILSMFKQILIGLETIKADVVYLIEHDVLYHPSHFGFTPPHDRGDVFYYNQNVWKLNSKDGQALFYYTKKTSQLCAWRDSLLAHYRNRVKQVEEQGFKRSMGFEPGTHKPPRGFDDFKSDVYMSKHPNIDIRHGDNLTANRFKKEQFRSKNATKGWKLKDSIPHWKKTKGRFDEFLKDISDRLAKNGV